MHCTPYEVIYLKTRKLTDEQMYLKDSTGKISSMMFVSCQFRCAIMNVTDERDRAFLPRLSRWFVKLDSALSQSNRGSSSKRSFVGRGVNWDVNGTPVRGLGNFRFVPMSRDKENVVQPLQRSYHLHSLVEDATCLPCESLAHPTQQHASQNGRPLRGAPCVLHNFTNRAYNRSPPVRNVRLLCSISIRFFEIQPRPRETTRGQPRAGRTLLRKGSAS